MAFQPRIGDRDASIPDVISHVLDGPELQIAQLAEDLENHLLHLRKSDSGSEASKQCEDVIHALSDLKTLAKQLSSYSEFFILQKGIIIGQRIAASNFRSVESEVNKYASGRRTGTSSNSKRGQVNRDTVVRLFHEFKARFPKYTKKQCYREIAKKLPDFGIELSEKTIERHVQESLKATT